MPIRRYESLDWLRGLTALSILVFHLGENGYLGGAKDSSSLIGKLGIYGVSIFFIISGLSIAIAYDRYLNDRMSAVTFFIRRVFRIWPLLWVAIAIVTIFSVFEGKNPSIFLLTINFTTLFGFIAPTKYINTGAWSIGNEMVYYALTPIIIKIYKSDIKIGNIVFATTLVIGFVFSNILLVDALKLSSQWHIYVNPFNNLFFYVSGIAIYYNFRYRKLEKNTIILIIIISVLCFVCIPTEGDQINIVTGFNRILFSIFCISIVFGFYFLKLNLPFRIGEIFEQIGIATYGIYILHPIVINALEEYILFLVPLNDYMFVFMVIFSTIAISSISYRFFENPIMLIGKKWTEKILSQSLKKEERVERSL